MTIPRLYSGCCFVIKEYLVKLTYPLLHLSRPRYHISLCSHYRHQIPAFPLALLLFPCNGHFTSRLPTTFLFPISHPLSLTLPPPTYHLLHHDLRSVRPPILDRRLDWSEHVSAGTKCPSPPSPTPRLASPPPRSRSSDSSNRLPFRATPAMASPGAEGQEEPATLARARQALLPAKGACCWTP